MTPEELRRAAGNLESEGHHIGQTVMLMAADTIERLQRENASLRQSIELCSGSCRLPEDRRVT